MLHIVSAFVMVLIALGVYLRAQPQWHTKIMSTAFALDFSLVVYIELTRHAVEVVLRHGKALIWTHAMISLGVLIGYALMLGLGRQLMRGRMQWRHTHRVGGISFVVLRVLNYATALML